MRVPRIYLDAEICPGQVLALPGKQSSYLCRVLRMQAGRELWLFNGRGGAFHAELLEADARSAQVAIGEFDAVDRESPLQLELMIALSKGDRFDLVLQKATELGVTRIQPLVTERTEVRLNSQRLAKKLDHWQGVLVSACEQSGRNRVPELLVPAELEAVLNRASALTGILMDPLATQGVAAVEGLAEGVRLLVGPEGGLSEREVARAQQAGFQGVRLGPRVLRTETAPLAMISILQSLYGDLGC